jgi:sortase A
VTKKIKFLRTLQLAFCFIGLSALAYTGMSLGSAFFYQSQQIRKFQPASSTPSSTTVQPGSFDNPSLQPVPDGVSFARLDIPRLGLADVIVEGDDEKSLRKAIGHIPDTALPGNSGNVGLAGHRDTFFRPLEGIRTGDIILIKTSQAIYRYEVESSAVVLPKDSWVLKHTDNPSLTLVTCFPFHYIGSAPKRFIVHARQVPDR